jgi:hypothetical protein
MIMLDISRGQVFVSLETDGNCTALVNPIMRLTADRHCVRSANMKLVWWPYRLELLSSSGECCNQRLEP